MENGRQGDTTTMILPPCMAMPNMTLRVFADAAWMGGVAGSEQFVQDVETFLEKAEAERLDIYQLPAEISTYIDRLSQNPSEKISQLLLLSFGPVTSRPANNPSKSVHHEDQIPKTQPRLRQLAENTRWEPSTALVLGGEEYIVEAISPSGKLILRREGFSPFPSDWEGFLVLDSDEALAQPPSFASKRKFSLPSVDMIGGGTEWDLFAHYLLPRLSKFWKKGSFYHIDITARGKREDGITPEMVRDCLAHFPMKLLYDLRAVVLADKPVGRLEGEYKNYVITVFPLRRKEDLIVVLLHELMHHAAHRLFGKGGILEHAEWAEAIRKDKRYVSKYALTNRIEDFAETATLYFLSHRGVLGNTRLRFPNRFRLLDEIFRSCFQENPPPLPPTVA